MRDDVKPAGKSETPSLGEEEEAIQGMQLSSVVLSFQCYFAILIHDPVPDIWNEEY